MTVRTIQAPDIDFTSTKSRHLYFVIPPDFASSCIFVPIFHMRNRKLRWLSGCGMVGKALILSEPRAPPKLVDQEIPGAW